LIFLLGFNISKETAAEDFAELDHDWQALLIKGFSDTDRKCLTVTSNCKFPFDIILKIK